AQPALVHVRHADPLGLLGDDLLGLLLRADEQDRAAVGDGLLDELVGVVDVPERLLQVDDVDAVALGEDEPLHLRVPPTGLMPEVDAAVEQLLHADDGHPSRLLRRACSSPALLAPREAASVVATTGWPPPWCPVSRSPVLPLPGDRGGRHLPTGGRRTREVDPPWRAAQRVYGSGG